MKFKYILLQAILLFLASTYNGVAQSRTKLYLDYTGSSLILKPLLPVGTTSSTVPLTKTTAIHVTSTSAKSSNTGSTGPRAIPFTVADWQNRLLIVSIGSRPDNPVSSVTYDGIALTKMGEISDGTTAKAELWYLLNPPVKTADVVVSWPGTLEYALGISYFRNVDISDPFGTSVTKTETVLSPFNILDVPSNIGDIIIDIVAKTGNQPVVGAGQTSVLSDGTNSIKIGSSYKAATAGTSSMTWTSGGSSSNWAGGAVAIKGFANDDATFNLESPLCQPLTLNAGTYSSTIYISDITGTLSPTVPVTLELSYGTTTILQSTSAQFTSTGGNAGYLTWSGTISETTIPGNNSLTLTLQNDLTTASFRVDYGSTSSASFIDLPVQNFITSLQFENSSGSSISSTPAGNEITLKAVVTNPFGSAYSPINFALVEAGTPSQTYNTASSTTTCITTYTTKFTPAATSGTITATATLAEPAFSAHTLSASPITISDDYGFSKNLTTASPVWTIGNTVSFDLVINAILAGGIATATIQDNYDPACLQFVSSTPAATTSNTTQGLLTWDIYNIAQGATYTVTAQFQIIGSCQQTTNTGTVTNVFAATGGVSLASLSDSETINIDYAAVVNDDTYCITDPVFTLDILANDTDPDISSVKSQFNDYDLIIVGSLPAGLTTVTLISPGVLSPTGTITSNGNYTIQYRLKEKSTGLTSNIATITLNYSVITETLTLTNREVQTTTSKPITIDVRTGVNFHGLEIGTPSIIVSAQYGSVVVNSNKTITYTPYEGFQGVDVFQYQLYAINCTQNIYSTATVTVNVDEAIYVCDGSTATLRVPAVSDAIKYSWMLPVGATVVEPSGATFTPTVTTASGTFAIAEVNTNTITINWSNVPAGTYSVSVNAINDCGESTFYTMILVINKVEVAATVTNVACFGSATGAISLTPSGGIPPYRYAWTGPNGYTASIANISQLVAGTYTVTVTDNLGCTTTTFYVVSQPESAVAISNVATVSDTGSSNGSVTFDLSGGTGNYTYSIDNFNTSTTTASTSGISISGLSSGTYTLKVRDGNLCQTEVVFTINGTGPLVISYLNGTHVACFGSSNGTISLEVLGGTGSYTYAWTGPNSFTATTQDLTGLAAGTYNVTVTSGAETVTGSFTVTQPAAALAVTIASFDNQSCAATANGSINITVTGGTASYTYLWSSGAVTEDLSNLASGTYTVLVTDANGCTTSITQVITAPAPIVIAGTVTNSTCAVGGTISVSVTSGGTAPYSYQWSGPSSFTGNTASNTASISNLAPGYYTLVITDNNGCQITQIYQVKNACLGLAKAVSTPVNNGNGTWSLIYTLKVENRGSVTLNNLQITDDLSVTFAGTTTWTINSLTSSNFTVNPSYNGQANINLINPSALGNLAQNEVGYLQLAVTITPQSSMGTFTNTATAAAVDPNGLTVSDTSHAGNQTVESPGTNPTLFSSPTIVSFTENPVIGLAKALTAGPTSNGDGSYLVTYTLTVRNMGDVPLNNIQVTDNLSETFTLSAINSVTATSSYFTIKSNYNGTTNTNLLSGTNSLTLNGLQTIVLSVRVTPTTTGPLNNTAVANATGVVSTTSDTSHNGTNPDPDNDGNPGNNNDPTPVSFTENPVIGLAKRIVGTPVNNGNGTYTLVYNFVVKNLGDGPLYNVQVVDNLSSTFEGRTVVVNGLSVTNLTANNSFNGTTDTNLLSGTNSLTLNQSGTISLTVTVTPGDKLGVYSNTAVASAAGPLGTQVSDISHDGNDPDPENDGPGNNSTATPITFTENPVIGLAKTVSQPINRQDGTYTIDYTLTVENKGNVPLTNIQVTDNLSSTFSGATAWSVTNKVSSANLTINSSFNGSTVTETLIAATSSLTLNQSGTITLTLLVTPGSNLGVYNNTAVAFANSLSGKTVSDTSTNGTNSDPDNDGNPGNNSVVTPISFTESAALTVTKTLSTVETISDGVYSLTYTITAHVSFPESCPFKNRVGRALWGVSVRLFTIFKLLKQS